MPNVIIVHLLKKTACKLLRSSFFVIIIEKRRDFPQTKNNDGYYIVTGTALFTYRCVRGGAVICERAQIQHWKQVLLLLNHLVEQTGPTQQHELDYIYIQDREYFCPL